ncbi:MAG: hypothetical protein K8F91_24625 [Candidatus Obscuribacterales bacterium]|nr:hypothetical protein [Candidatus Obscuribacterales bacterium]
MKVSRYLTIPLISALASCLALPVLAQGYHYNYGNGRVINMNQVGLNHSESTYLPTGAINNTAKGVITGGVGQKANPLLPGVKWGSTVGTSGDNFYQGGAPDKSGQVYRQDRRAIYRHQVQQAQQMEQRRLKGGQVYYPGQNASQSNGYNRNGGTASYSSGGAASYADVATPTFNANGNGNNNNNANTGN